MKSPSKDRSFAARRLTLHAGEQAGRPEPDREDMRRRVEDFRLIDRPERMHSQLSLALNRQTRRGRRTLNRGFEGGFGGGFGFGFGGGFRRGFAGAGRGLLVLAAAGVVSRRKDGLHAGGQMAAPQVAARNRNPVTMSGTRRKEGDCTHCDDRDWEAFETSPDI